VENALREVRKTPNKKKALVLITDAFTEGNIKSLQRSIRSSEVLIYTFAIRGVEQSAVYPTATISATFGSTDEAKAQQVLDTLAAESGGLSQIFELNSEELLTRMIAFIQEITAELRGQYTIGYYPQTPSAADRKIRVRARAPEHVVRMRRDVMVR
jgi:hypothetical protein